MIGVTLFGIFLTPAFFFGPSWLAERRRRNPTAYPVDRTTPALRLLRCGSHQLQIRCQHQANRDVPTFQQRIPGDRFAESFPSSEP